MTRGQAGHVCGNHVIEIISTRPTRSIRHGTRIGQSLAHLTRHSGHILTQQLPALRRPHLRSARSTSRTPNRCSHRECAWGPSTALCSIPLRPQQSFQASQANGAAVTRQSCEVPRNELVSRRSAQETSRLGRLSVSMWRQNGVLLYAHCRASSKTVNAGCYQGSLFLKISCKPRDFGALNGLLSPDGVVGNRERRFILANDLVTS